MRDVTVAIPAILPRRSLLSRALHSVTNQVEPVAAVAIAVDSQRDGAWTTRNRAIAMVHTTWTAFLDDDDELLPHHTQFLLDRCEEHGLDMAWGWFSVVGGGDPFPYHRGRQYDPDDFHVVPITYLVRTELLHEAIAATGGFASDPENTGAWHVQDRFVFDWMARNGKHQAFNDITWLWHHHLGNTSGLPDRWPAERKAVVFR